MKQIIDYRNYLEEIDKFITNEEHQCLFLGCTEKAVASHSIQKKGPLKKIADKGFIYCLDSSLSRSFDVKNQTSSIKFRKTPISKASTFPGFCDDHEKLFHTFEIPGLDVSNKKHLLYLYYRTLGYEIVRQRMSTKRLEIRLGRLYLSRMVSHAMGSSEFIAEADFKEMLKIKSKYGEEELFTLFELTQGYINSESMNKLIHLTLVVPKNLGVACSSCTYISEEHFSVFRQKYPNEELPTITFNVVPDDNKTYVIISWDVKYDRHSTWIREVFNSEPELILNDFVFYRSEDVCISPKLWNDSASLRELVKETEHILGRTHSKTLDVLKI